MRKLLPAVLAIAFVAGCGVTPTSKAPVRAGTATKAAAKQAADSKFLRISYVTANGMMGTNFEAPPNHYIRLQAYTSAPFGSQLDWNWRSFAGFVSGFNDRATWYTPSYEGTFTIDVQVRDKQNGFDWETLYFRVKKQATELEALDEPVETEAK